MLYLIEARNTYNAKVAVEADNPKEAVAKLVANRSTVECEYPLFDDDINFLNFGINRVDATITETADGIIEDAEDIFDKSHEDENKDEPIDYYSD